MISRLSADPPSSLEIPAASGLEVRSFCHSKRRRKACKKVAVVLAFRHALRAHESLGRPDALPGFLEIVHRLFEEGVFILRPRSIRTLSIFRLLNSFAPRE